MKAMKISFLVFTLMMSMNMLMAQSEDRFSIGPRLGANFSNVSHVDASQSITGVAIGLTSTYSFNEHFGLTMDALYAVQGYKAPFENFHLRYLEFPLYVDYFGGKLGDRFRPKVYAGLVPGFFLGGIGDDLDVNKRYFSKFNLAASAGVGMNCRLANRVWLNADLRYLHGLTDIRDSDYRPGDPIKFRTLQATLGVAYGLSKL